MPPPHEGHGPPPHKPHRPPPHKGHKPAHAKPVSGRLHAFGGASAIDRARLDAILAPLLPDAGDRAFVLRCIVDEGPAHHRVANYALLALLAEVAARVEAAGTAPRAPATDARRVEVPLRLPPHLADALEGESAYPLQLPLRPLDLLAPPGSATQGVLADALTDGPPQHALANAAMVALLDRILAHLPSADEGPGR